MAIVVRPYAFFAREFDNSLCLRINKVASESNLRLVSVVPWGWEAEVTERLEPHPETGHSLLEVCR